MAIDVEMEGKPDPEHLRYAVENGLILVTIDRKFAHIANQMMSHYGIICWTGNQDDIGGMTRLLTAFVLKNALNDLSDQVFWLK